MKHPKQKKGGGGGTLITEGDKHGFKPLLVKTATFVNRIDMLYISDGV